MKKLIFIFLSMLIITGLFFISGCAEPETAENGFESEIETPRAANEVITEEDGETPDFKYIFNTNSVPQIINYYQEFRFNVLENGQIVSTIHYLYQGTEKINGKETDKVEVDFGYEGTFIFWVDDAGELQKAESGGDEIPVEVVNSSMQHLLRNLLLPFDTVYEWNVVGGLQGEVPGITSQELDVRQEEFGADTVSVYTFEVIIETPVLDEGEKGKMVWEIADFSDYNKQQVVRWEVIEGKGIYFQNSFEIDRLIFR